jgi:hypothetical protein
MKFNGQIIWKVLSYTGLYLTRFAPDLVQCWKRYGLNGSFLRLSAWSEGLGQYLEKFFNLFDVLTQLRVVFICAFVLTV